MILVKNGPVYSNISNINRSFRTFGSPLHIDLITDYVRTHWENGRGTTIENAQDLVKWPLKAQYYYAECEEEDHYIRKEVICEKLNDLFQQLRWYPNPFLYSNKAISATMNDINLDPRFDTISSDGGAIYLILTDWNLLNDLVMKHMMEHTIKAASISELYQEILSTYKIDDPNAYFFPKIDPRFHVSKKNIVSLINQDVFEELSGQVTEYIKENVVIHLPAIKNYLMAANAPISIREILQKIFSIQPHFPLFNSYFQAVKQSIPFVHNIFLINKDALVISTETIAPEKINVIGNPTDFSAISKKVTSTLDYFSDNAAAEIDHSTVRHEVIVKEKETLSYTIRYFDRIQETLPAHYFKNWIVNDYVEVLLIDNDTNEHPLLFQFDKKKNILFGEHLSNFMIDYDLEPGQKLEFRKKEATLYMTIGIFDENAHTEQMKYEDIARLAEVKHYGLKSLMQNLAELLMLHPSGLHIRQILLDIRGETSYTESSIRGTLSSYPFFEKIPEKIGYWRFNPRQWKKKYMETPNVAILDKNLENKIKKINNTLLSLPMLFRKKAYSTRTTKRRLTNHQYEMLPKETFLELAWEYYSFTIYQYARNNTSATLPLEDLFQEAYFALNKSYEKYKPEKGRSFYHYFKRRLSSWIRRYKMDYSGMIRIPVHRREFIYKVDKKIEESILLNKHLTLEYSVLSDYTLSKSNYISFEELYMKDTVTDDDRWNAKIFSFFNSPIFQNQSQNKNLLDFLPSEEPDRFDVLKEDNDFEKYAIDKLLIKSALEFLKNKVRNSRDYEVMLYLYGFKTGNKMTLQEVADIFNITREGIRQIDLKCLRILKQYKGLKEANLKN